MSTLSAIASAVKSYLQVGTPGASSAILGTGTVANVEAALDPLIVIALNNARKWAEMKHDFRLVDVTVRVPVLVGQNKKVLGVDLINFYDPADVTVRLKTIEQGYVLSDTGTMQHINIISKKLAVARERERDRVYQPEYPDMDRVDTNLNCRRVYIHGDLLVFDPALTEAGTLVLDGSRWLPDYTSGLTETDFFVQHGSAYLQWAAMVEANHLIKTYVPRQEGSLPPPIQQRDEAFGALVDWDNFATEGAHYSDRN